MTAAKATAEVFYAAFKAMDAKERNAFLARLFADRRLREDLMDAAVINARRHQPTRPLRQVLAELEQGNAKQRR